MAFTNEILTTLRPTYLGNSNLVDVVYSVDVVSSVVLKEDISVPYNLL